MLDLEPSKALVMHHAPAIDFGRAPGRDSAAVAVAAGEPAREGLPYLLDLEPQKEVVMPSHPTTVVMRADPNAPIPRRQRRWPVMRADGGDDGILNDIERALAEAPPPPSPMPSP